MSVAVDSVRTAQQCHGGPAALRDKVNVMQQHEA